MSQQPSASLNIPEGDISRPGVSRTPATPHRRTRSTTGSLLRIASRLQPRDYTLAHLLDEHRYLTTGQISSLLFSSARTCRNRLDAPRRIGFIDWFTPVLANGSRLPVHWVPGPLSARYVALSRGERPPSPKAVREYQDRRLSARYVPHNDGANQFGVDLLVHARTHREASLLRWWSVSTQRAAGWKLIPIYVGPQAPCTKSTSTHKLSLTTPAADAQAAAADAVTQARALGLNPDSVLIYDMESYAGDAACEAAVLTFLSAWTAELHDLSYLSGVYGDISSTVTGLVAAHRTPGFVPPDYLDVARWVNVATLTDVAFPADHWAGRRRMKQYRGPHKETCCGVTINVDGNLVDLVPAPETRAGDFTGNGWSDLLTVTASGALDLRSGNGATLTSRRLGTGWSAMDTIIRPGDVNGDGRDDLIARETATGRLWLYPGTGSGLAARVNIGKGWGGLREITAVGDVDRDGKPDLVAVEAGTGRLLLFPGKRTGLGAGGQVGSRDWSLVDELAGVGDVDGDGVGDLVARTKDTGMLRLYGGWGRTMNSFREVLPGAAGLRGLAGAGDFDRDGTLDLTATDAATGTLYRYPVQPGGLGLPVPVAEGMAGLTVL